MGYVLGSGVDVKEENKDKNTLSVSSRYLSLFPNFIIGNYFPNQIGVYLKCAYKSRIDHSKKNNLYYRWKNYVRRRN